MGERNVRHGPSGVGGERAAERARKSAWARRRGRSLVGGKEHNSDLEADERLW
jgi:hypothetical protein